MVELYYFTSPQSFYTALENGKLLPAINLEAIARSRERETPYTKALWQMRELVRKAVREQRIKADDADLTMKVVLSADQNQPYPLDFPIQAYLNDELVIMQFDCPSRTVRTSQDVFYRASSVDLEHMEKVYAQRNIWVSIWKEMEDAHNGRYATTIIQLPSSLPLNISMHQIPQGMSATYCCLEGTIGAHETIQ